ncbi:UNVERIFIED_ORG: DNA-binding transcriptional LysR family regulator [Rhizobium sophorae]|uniref:LysR family transcriptional regulator n=1 Tax=Rhizobium leguminosarum TaxID=384 RepID=UPI0016093C84|nr:LysR family transcriptional regulator [Rhizobium leguminosarum]MBB4524903.1 DNA-binding transcriptional LysR family regulator [Rhizobium leguminosarum]MDH6661916.1 DNA-binding transcriptional LysR family regulator [Rhizobium sophorae]
MPASHLNLDPKKLLYLASIIESGSLKSAAKALEISQPALSTSMSRLEAELGLQILLRGPTGVTPTPIGEVLYGHARLVRDAIELAERALLNVNGDHPLSIRIGSLPSLASTVMPMALSRWREAHADRDLQVVEAPQIDLLIGLLRGEFDFVFGFTECYDLEDGLRQRVLFRDKLLVIARSEHPLSTAKNLSWETLVRYPWVAPTARRAHAILAAALKIAKLAPPERVTVCGSVTLLKSLVIDSDHLAVLPAHAVRSELADGRLCGLAITDPALDRNIAVFFRDGYHLDGHSRDLVKFVEAVGQELCRRPDAGPAEQASLQEATRLECPRPRKVSQGDRP